MRLPELFKEQMKTLLGDEYDDYIASYDAARVQGLRVNTGKISVSEFLKITPFHLTPIPWVENGFYYQIEDAVTKHPHYHAGLYYIQEPSAMIPASRLPISEGDKVLDLCAAPGGKATELGAKLQCCEGGRAGLLAANDISHSRAKGLLKNLELFGLGNILVTSETPENLQKHFAGYFDKILVDAPCSGEGMFRKDPAMIRDWEERGPAYYSILQKEILTTAVNLLKPGGMLLYSTCTFSPLENEEMIRWVLETFKEFQVVPIEQSEYLSVGSLPGTVRVWPHHSGGEGHFAALLKKNGQDHEVTKRTSMPGTETKMLNKLSAEAEEFLNNIPVLKNSSGMFTVKENKVYLLPAEFPFHKRLRYLRTGLYLGECKKKRFEPSQALAMYLNPKTYESSISFDGEDLRVRQYLKGETVSLADEEMTGLSGWVLVCVDGHSLGWAKLINGSLRNKYYPGWRLQ